MDTKLRKSTKLAKLIIAIFVILPAILLVSLYPTMEEAMKEKVAYYEELQKQDEEVNDSWVLIDNLVNYAMEISYYVYADIWNSLESEKLDTSVFDAYGWNNDFSMVRDNASLIITYQPSEGDQVVRTYSDKLDDSVCRLTLEFDSYGNLTLIDLKENQKLYATERNMYQQAMDSVNQFNNNLSFYESTFDTPISEEQYMPKNFKLELGINENSGFTGTYKEWFGEHSYDLRPENLYWETGSYGIIPIIYLFLIAIAMTLPFVKRLNTGYEKFFSMSLEVMVMIVGIVVAGTVGMGYAMSYSTMETARDFANSTGGFMFVGTVVQPKVIYGALLGINVIGWSIVFFLVYAIGANLRQLICDTKYYLKYQTFSIRFFRWLKRVMVKVYHKLTDVNWNSNVDNTVSKIVLVNLGILLLLGCLKFFGMIGVLIYSIILWVFMRKKLHELQKQYQNVLHATEQMAKGDLKISLEEDLGVLQPIGDSLEKIQQGFEKAVLEEAKSQSMKTELITNVSHDLKTPLTAIITYVDLLKKEDATEEEKKSYIKTLEQKSQRLKVLIEDLFEVSKAQSGNVTMNFMEVDVVSLMKQVKSEMSDQIEASSLDFRFNLPEEKIVLSLDGQRTYRVFENLIGNTIKYSMPFSRVYVDVLNENDEVKIVFRNVSAQELRFDPERLTDRFVRGDASRNSEGSGLGLAIAKSFVELQHGNFKIDVDGDLFKVTLSWRK